MNDQSSTLMSVKDTTSNPGPLGLLGFGMTTVLLNMHNAGLFELNAMILAMGVFYGGLAQVIAGIMEWKKGNTFGTAAFTSYGFFWLSLVGILVMPKMGVAAPASSVSMAAYLMMWGVFTLAMFIGSLKHNMATRVVFGSLTVLFLLLALGDFTEIRAIKVVAGIEGIFCGASAIYSAVAQILNGEYKKTVLPLG